VVDAVAVAKLVVALSATFEVSDSDGANAGFDPQQART
ncbi:unnamed protein product, partial [Acidithrix sp. C25]